MSEITVGEVLDDFKKVVDLIEKAGAQRLEEIEVEKGHARHHSAGDNSLGADGQSHIDYARWNTKFRDAVDKIRTRDGCSGTAAMVKARHENPDLYKMMQQNDDDVEKQDGPVRKSAAQIQAEFPYQQTANELRKSDPSLSRIAALRRARRAAE